MCHFKSSCPKTRVQAPAKDGTYKYRLRVETEGLIARPLMGMRDAQADFDLPQGADEEMKHVSPYRHDPAFAEVGD
jgi:hypothetical protein